MAHEKDFEAGTSVRSVARTVRGVETHEGGAFLVRRPFPTGALEDFDPSLLLDEMGPSAAGHGRDWALL
jgi:hypothetical protein